MVVGRDHAAIEFGFDTVGCASTGNLAHSVAAHAAQAGLEAVMFIPHDLEKGKVVGTLVFGPRLVKIRGNYDDVNRLCTEIADEYGWAIVNVNLRPYYTEGAKTHGFEIAEQLGWRLPQHTVIPVAGGTILPKVWKAYREFDRARPRRGQRPEDLRRAGRGLQSGGARDREGCRRHSSRRSRTRSPRASRSATRRTGTTRSAWCASRAAHAASATDDEILDAIELLARTEGIFTEPAGGTTLACAIKLIESGRDPARRVDRASRSPATG